jgi:proteasome lid subunit RPN8/RPN11
MEGIMTLIIPPPILENIHQYGESVYPEEGAGLMLGFEKDGKRFLADIVLLNNAREESARHNRYLITAEDMLKGEKEAERLGLSIIGIFHSHPDHPNLPSEFDREYAIPWYSYLITSVNKGQAIGSRVWRLKDDRSIFDEEDIILSPPLISDDLME